jgi:NNP family nitrate/nitrite transporter-like MFS transporter
VGVLTDRFGGRMMFPLVSAATIVPVLYLGPAGRTATPFVVTAVLLAVYAVAAALPRRRSSPRRPYDER